MKTIDYKLRSMEGITIRLPLDTREHFYDLKIMLDSSLNLTDFKEKMEQHSYFAGIEGVEYNNLVYTAGKLKRTKIEKLKDKYMDDLYIQLGQRDLKHAKKDVQDMNANLDRLYSKIYKKRK